MRHIPFKICDQKTFKFTLRLPFYCLRQTLILICKIISFHTIYGIRVLGRRPLSGRNEAHVHVEYEQELIRQSVCLATRAEEHLRPIVPLSRSWNDSTKCLTIVEWQTYKDGVANELDAENDFLRWIRNGENLPSSAAKASTQFNKHRKLNPLASKFKYRRKYYILFFFSVKFITSERTRTSNTYYLCSFTASRLLSASHTRCARICVSFIPPKPNANRMENKIELYPDGMWLHVLLYSTQQRFVVQSHFCSSDSYAVCLWLCTRLKSHAQHIKTRQYITHNLSMQTRMTRRSRARERVSVDTVSPFRVVWIQMWLAVRIGCVQLEINIIKTASECYFFFVSSCRHRLSCPIYADYLSLECLFSFCFIIIAG